MTDSTIALAWIKNPSSKFNTYVANRLSAIQEISLISELNHIACN